MKHDTTMEEDVHKILQEEIADEVWYESSNNERRLSRCLENVETRLSILFKSRVALARADARKGMYTRSQMVRLIAEKESIARADEASTCNERIKHAVREREEELIKAFTDVIVSESYAYSRYMQMMSTEEQYKNGCIARDLSNKILLKISDLALLAPETLPTNKE